METEKKGYETVYWGKMPVNFRPQAFRKQEVEKAVGYAGRSFAEVLDLVPDFSVMMLNKGPEGDTKTVLVLGDEREARVFRRGAQEDGSLEGLLWEVALRIRSRSRGMQREHLAPG
jgi:hypothetical protein